MAMRLHPLILLFLICFQARAQDQLAKHFFSVGIAGTYFDHERKTPNNLIGPTPDIAAATSVLLLRRFRNREHAWGVGGGVLSWGDRLLYPVHLALHMDVATLFSKDKTLDPTRNTRWKITAGIGAIFGDVHTTDGVMTKGVLYHAGYRYRITNGSMKVHVGIMSNLFRMRGPFKRFIDGEWIEEEANFGMIGPALWLDL